MTELQKSYVRAIEGGTNTVQGLADRFGCSRANAAQIVARLERRGVVVPLGYQGRALTYKTDGLREAQETDIYVFSRDTNPEDR